MNERRGLSRRRILAVLLAAAGVRGLRDDASAEEPNLSGSLWLADGPCGAQPRLGQPCRARREPAGGVRILVGRDGEAARDVTLDGNGRFALAVPPGVYRIALAPGQPGLRMDPRRVTVPEGDRVTVDIDVTALRP